MMQGMALGAGSEIAHQGIRSMMGGSGGHDVTSAPPQQEQMQQNQMQQPICQNEQSGFVDCLKFNNNNISSCQSFFDSLKQCESR